MSVPNFPTLESLYTAVLIVSFQGLFRKQSHRKHLSYFCEKETLFTKVISHAPISFREKSHRRINIVLDFLCCSSTTSRTRAFLWKFRNRPSFLWNDFLNLTIAAVLWPAMTPSSHNCHNVKGVFFSSACFCRKCENKLVAGVWYCKFYECIFH